MILAGKRIVITGVIDRHSIAYAVADRALGHGAEVVLTGFGRTRRMTQRAARRLPGSPEVLELDANSDANLAALAIELERRWGGVDGLLHAIAHAPADALGGRFMSAPRRSAIQAFETSAYSLKALACALAPLMASPAADRPEGGAIVGLDFDASVAWPSYDWMGVAKAGLESVARYLARDLGSQAIRINLVSAGPISTAAASGIAGFAALAEGWERVAPLGWNRRDADAVADAVVFLLSDLSRAVSGEILHADGGAHAVAAIANHGPVAPA